MNTASFEADEVSILLFISIEASTRQPVRHLEISSAL